MLADANTDTKNLKKTNNSVSTPTFQNATSKPELSSTAPTDIKHVDHTNLTSTSSPKITSTQKSFEETMRNVLKNTPPSSGSQANDNTQGSVSHISIHDAAKGLCLPLCLNQIEMNFLKIQFTFIFKTTYLDYSIFWNVIWSYKNVFRVPF